MQMLGGKPSEGGNQGGKQPARQAAGRSNPQAESGGGASGFDDMDDDIPFATASLARDVIWKKLRHGCV
jgi:single-stranded DNA-binding protein